MELTILLSKVLGLYLLIGGAAIMLRQGYYMPVVGAFAKEPLTRMVLASLELLGGLLIVMAHDVWTPLPAAIISAIGLLLIIEGTMYMVVSNKVVDRIVHTLNNPIWYTGGGILAVAVGVYLSMFGFGLI